MSEKNFSKLFIKHLPKDAHHQRIETGDTGRGIPDINIGYDSREYWVELKVVKGRQIKLSPEQIAWHFRRTRAGGVTWIIAQDKYEGVRKGKGDVIYAWEGQHSMTVADKGLNFDAKYKWEGPFNWPEIMWRLFNAPKPA